MRLAVLLVSTLPWGLSTIPFPLVPAPPAGSPRMSRMLVTWTPGEARCTGGGSLSNATIRRPFNSLTWGTGQLPPKATTLQFGIDPSGRPVSIRFESPRFASGNLDLAPALAASKFPGGPRSACTITYTPQAEPLPTAPLEDLISYTMTPISGPLLPEGLARINEGGDCFKAPRPQTLTRQFPDFQKIPATPGVKDWVMIGYDTNASGKPITIRRLAGTGNAVLEARAAKAVRGSRFGAGARSGCHYAYWRTPETLPAPPMPAEDALRPANATCSDDRRWAVPLTLRYPAAYRRRKIEGWAIVSYDTAPWGSLGNVKVLRAEPSDDFGVQAVQIMQNAKVEPSPSGSTGCVDRIKFVMPADDAPEADAEAQ